MAVLSLTNQPSGVRFSPTDVELIVDYLRKKINGNDEEEIGFIPTHNFYTREPWEWPDFSGIESNDQEWFIFSPPVLKNPDSTTRRTRYNRETKAGYWKVSGEDLEIWSGESLIGIKKFLVFLEGRTRKRKKTDWVMHEYHATLMEKTFVLCRLFKRDNKGSNGRKRKSSGKVGPAKSKRSAASVSPAPGVQDEDHRTTNECLHSENSEGSKGRKRKYSSRKAGPAKKSKRGAASVSPALEKQAEDHTTTNECLHSQSSDSTIASVDSSDSNYNAFAADNQVEEMAQVIADEVDQQMETNPLTPITAVSDAAADSSPNTAKSSPEEAESDLTQASVSSASVQAEDYPRIDGTTSDSRAPVECGDNNFNANAEENPVADTEFDLLLEEYIKMLPDLMQNPLDCNPAKSSPEEAESDLTQASVSSALVQAEDYPRIDGTTSDSRAPVECGDNNFNANAEENPVADTEFDLLLEEYIKMLPDLMQNPLDCNPAKSSPEEAESEPTQASISPATGEEANNHVTRCNPTNTFDGTTSNTTALTECNPISDNTYTTKNQVAEVTAGKVVDSNMSCVPPPELPDLDWSLLSTLLSLDTNSPDEFLYNDPSSQKNPAFDCETMKNMESVKDDGSHSSTPIAEMHNELLFDPTVQRFYVV